MDTMEINAMTRFEKLQYLLENPFLDKKFITDCTMLREMVYWMSEEDFSSFFTHLCGHFDLECPTEQEEMVFSA